jgi:hypothetical protein
MFEPAIAGSVRCHLPHSAKSTGKPEEQDYDPL